MTREELFSALATKKIDSFHTSVLGFTLGSLMDRGVTAEEAHALCDLLLEQIAEAKKNPETLAALDKFQTLVETQIGMGQV
jgi:hypothetical protein